MPVCLGQTRGRSISPCSDLHPVTTSTDVPQQSQLRSTRSIGPSHHHRRPNPRCRSKKPTLDALTPLTSATKPSTFRTKGNSFPASSSLPAEKPTPSWMPLPPRTSAIWLSPTSFGCRSTRDTAADQSPRERVCKIESPPIVSPTPLTGEAQPSWALKAVFVRVQVDAQIESTDRDLGGFKVLRRILLIGSLRPS